MRIFRVFCIVAFFGGFPGTGYAQTVPAGLKYEIAGGSVTVTRYSGGAAELVIPGQIEGLPVTVIGINAFEYNSGLGKVVIPNSVTTIGAQAFQKCRRLTSVVIPNSVTAIGEWAFYDCPGLTSIQVDEGNPQYMSIEGVLFTKDRTVLIQYPMGKQGAAYTIPNTVKQIDNSAFYKCSGLTSVVIPNSVTVIDHYAFQWCSGLTGVVIPDSVASIGEEAFIYCSGLTSAVIGNSVTSIGARAFNRCSGLTAVVIGTSVASIGDGAFVYCSRLTNVVIPNSVASIGDAAFFGCTNLKSVTLSRKAKFFVDDVDDEDRDERFDASSFPSRVQLIYRD